METRNQQHVHRNYHRTHNLPQPISSTHNPTHQHATLPIRTLRRQSPPHHDGRRLDIPVAVTAGDKIEGLGQCASGRCLSADRAEAGFFSLAQTGLETALLAGRVSGSCGFAYTFTPAAVPILETISETRHSRYPARGEHHRTPRVSNSPCRPPCTSPAQGRPCAWCQDRRAVRTE